jgi:hypothetical protein
MRRRSTACASILSCVPLTIGAVSVALACGALGGCSSSSSGAVGDGGPSFSVDSGGGGPSDDGGGSNDGGADGGGTVTAGEVGFASGGSGALAGAYTIVGVFDRGSGHLGSGTGSAICETPVGSCTYCNSNVDAGLSGGNLMITLLSAGVLTVKDGTTTLGTLDYMADDAGMGDYEIDSNTDPALTWAAGDTLSASATGGAIPAFSASITAPQSIAGVTPALSLTSSATVSTSTPFVLSWTPSSDTGAQMNLVIGGFTGGTASCTAADSAGSVTVPVAILQKFGTGGGTMGLTKTVSKPIAVTGASVTIQATAPSVDGSVTFGP